MLGEQTPIVNKFPDICDLSTLHQVHRCDRLCATVRRRTVAFTFG
jgi:hypothetical protein